MTVLSAPGSVMLGIEIESLTPWMSFRKRHVGLSTAHSPECRISFTRNSTLKASGQRPSPLDGRPTTSTGTQTLDDLLAGHAGLPMGNSVLIEETGTTDFAGTLLRYYAAEGVAQNHHVYVVGMPEHWGRSLPGVVEGQRVTDSMREATSDASGDRMKIAWRYERLGEHGASSRATPKGDQGPFSSQDRASTQTTFCHTFDLTKRLTQTPNPPIRYIPCSPVSSSSRSPLVTIINTIAEDIRNASSNTSHRVIVPSLLSPAFYAAGSCDPTIILPFLHELRALLVQFPQQLTAMMSIPLSIHPRNTGLVRWVEQLFDGVIALYPFQHNIDLEPPVSGHDLKSVSEATAHKDERIQGILKVQKLPLLTEKGGGSGAIDDMAFSLGRRKFQIVKYHLPPEAGDSASQEGHGEGGTLGKGMDF